MPGVISGSQINPPILIEIAYSDLGDDGGGAAPRRRRLKVQAGLECSVAISEEDRNYGRVASLCLAINGNIGFSVAIEIRHNSLDWSHACRQGVIGGGRERSVAVPTKDGNYGTDGRRSTRHCQIELAIAVEVSDGDSLRWLIRVNRRRGRQGTVYVPKEHEDVARKWPTDDQIKVAVLVEVADGEGQ